MIKYQVVPTSAGESYSWKVERAGVQVSQHQTKANAKQAARRKASTGDRLIIHRKGGTIQRNTRVK